jgi:hypothetical protein
VFARQGDACGGRLRSTFERDHWNATTERYRLTVTRSEANRTVEVVVEGAVDAFAAFVAVGSDGAELPGDECSQMKALDKPHLEVRCKYDHDVAAVRVAIAPEIMHVRSKVSISR